VAVAHSQGNFFANEAYDELFNSLDVLGTNVVQLSLPVVLKTVVKIPLFCGIFQNLKVIKWVNPRRIRTDEIFTKHRGTTSNRMDE